MNKLPASADAALSGRARCVVRCAERKARLATIDWEAVQSNAAEFADEDFALAESDLPHRAELLTREDIAR